MPGPIPARRPPPARLRSLSWSSPRLRAQVYQLAAVLLLVLAVGFLVTNTLQNMRARGIQSGFDFLLQPAGFDIGEGWLRYESVDPYWKAFLVGLVNTLRVALFGCVLTTVLGTLLGIGRFSRNALLRGICYGYVELFRNIPVLLQLLMWYLLFTQYLPLPADALSVAEIAFISKNGFSFPVLLWQPGYWLGLAGLVLGVAAAFAYARMSRVRFEVTGVARPVAAVAALLVVGGAALGLLAGGAPLQFDYPYRSEIQIEGGSALSPEYLTVLIGLVLYTACYVAEVVRAGIASVAAGQHEAAAALGLSRRRALRLVLLPQALRPIIPPLTNQYLNLTKNSSLAVAVGYPDVVSIANTSLNQSGRAVECIAVIMLVYLTLSLSTSALMNWFNRRAALKER
ncbi:MAG: ABC transporter permease subunit [Pseudomonadota bacterium]|nr:ABC transporter permease subunit [Pseudomonadota bacterium]